MYSQFERALALGVEVAVHDLPDAHVLGHLVFVVEADEVGRQRVFRRPVEQRLVGRGGELDLALGAAPRVGAQDEAADVVEAGVDQGGRLVGLGQHRDRLLAERDQGDVGHRGRAVTLRHEASSKKRPGRVMDPGREYPSNRPGLLDAVVLVVNRHDQRAGAGQRRRGDRHDDVLVGRAGDRAGSRSRW